jgi:hypothetical protein
LGFTRAGLVGAAGNFANSTIANFNYTIAIVKSLASSLTFDYFYIAAVASFVNATNWDFNSARYLRSSPWRLAARYSRNKLATNINFNGIAARWALPTNFNSSAIVLYQPNWRSSKIAIKWCISDLLARSSFTTSIVRNNQIAKARLASLNYNGSIIGRYDFLVVALAHTRFAFLLRAARRIATRSTASMCKLSLRTHFFSILGLVFVLRSIAFAFIAGIDEYLVWGSIARSIPWNCDFSRSRLYSFYVSNRISSGAISVRIIIISIISIVVIWVVVIIYDPNNQ